MKTYLGTSEMKVGLGRKNYIHKAILLDDAFDIQFEFDYLSAITSNLTKLNHMLTFYKEEEGNQDFERNHSFRRLEEFSV